MEREVPQNTDLKSLSIFKWPKPIDISHEIKGINSGTIRSLKIRQEKEGRLIVVSLLAAKGKVLEYEYEAIAGQLKAREVKKWEPGKR